MSTPHNSAMPGDIARTVIMPGDPLRAKLIADNYLQNAVMFNRVRGMFGFTGLYKGKPISVMGSGMGMPSIGIYSYELYSQYGVENIIRAGSAGSYTEECKVFDVLLASAAFTESSYAFAQCGKAADTAYPSEVLNHAIEVAAQKADIPLKKRVIHSSDVFYREQDEKQADYWRELVAAHHCAAVEMESFALFHNARMLGKQAACLLTVSNSFVTNEETTAEQREKNFTQMILLALEAGASL